MGCRIFNSLLFVIYYIVFSYFLFQVSTKLILSRREFRTVRKLQHSSLKSSRWTPGPRLIRLGGAPNEHGGFANLIYGKKSKTGSTTQLGPRPSAAWRKEAEPYPRPDIEVLSTMSDVY